MLASGAVIVVLNEIHRRVRTEELLCDGVYAVRLDHGPEPAPW